MSFLCAGGFRSDPGMCRRPPYGDISIPRRTPQSWYEHQDKVFWSWPFALHVKSLRTKWCNEFLLLVTQSSTGGAGFLECRITTLRAFICTRGSGFSFIFMQLPVMQKYNKPETPAAESLWTAASALWKPEDYFTQVFLFSPSLFSVTKLGLLEHILLDVIVGMFQRFCRKCERTLPDHSAWRR